MVFLKGCHTVRAAATLHLLWPKQRASSPTQSLILELVLIHYVYLRLFSMDVLYHSIAPPFPSEADLVIQVSTHERQQTYA